MCNVFIIYVLIISFVYYYYLYYCYIVYILQNTEYKNNKAYRIKLHNVTTQKTIHRNGEGEATNIQLPSNGTAELLPTPYAPPCIFSFFQYILVQRPLCTPPALVHIWYTKYTVQHILPAREQGQSINFAYI